MNRLKTEFTQIQSYILSIVYCAGSNDAVHGYILRALRDKLQVAPEWYAKGFSDALNEMVAAGMLKEKRLRAENVYTISLPTMQLFELGKRMEFRRVLDELSTELAMTDLSSLGEWESWSFCDRLARVLSGHILCGNFDDFLRNYRYYSSYSHLNFKRCELLTCYLALGKTDKFPENLDARFLHYVFPFMSWNSVMRGGSAHSLLRKITAIYNAGIPDRLLEDYLLFLLWHGRKEELQDLLSSSIRDAAKEMVQATVSILNGEFEVAAEYYYRRYMFLEREYKNDLSYHNPLFLITCSLLFIATKKFPPVIARLEAHLQSNKNLEMLNDCGFVLAEIINRFKREQANNDGTITQVDYPPRVPLFQVMLHLLSYTNMVGNIMLKPQAVAMYEKAVNTLVTQNQRLTACYLLSALAFFSENDSPERERALTYCEQYGIVPPIQLRDTRKYWETMLEDFENSINELAEPEMMQKALQDQDKCISWRLSVAGMERRNSYRLKSIEPYLHQKKMNNDFSKGRALSLARLAEGLFDKYLNEQELHLRRSMVTDWRYSSIPLASLVFLEGNPLVYLENETVPVVLKKGKNAFDTAVGQTAGMVTLSLRYPFENKSDGSVYVYRSDENENELYYVTSSSIPQKVLDFFEKFGSGGKVSFPEEAVAQLTHTLSTLVDHFTIEGDLEGRIYANLQEVPGEIHLRMRMQQEGNCILFELKNRLCESNERLLVTPGTGAERIAGLRDDQRVLFARDFKTELAAAEKLVQDCPELQMSAEDHWQFESDDLTESLRILSRLKELNIELEWMKDRSLTVLPMIDTGAIRYRTNAGAGVDEWFSVGGDVQVDQDRVVDLLDLIQNLPHRVGEFIKLDDKTYLQLTHQLLHQLDALKTASVVRNKKIRILPAALPMLEHAFDGGIGTFLEKHLTHIHEAFREIPAVPDRFQGTLRPYQYEGYTYLCRMAGCRIGCCLADDMGLGKTIQLLALLLRNAENGASLIVAPASVCRNWEAEAHRFTPSLNVIVLGNKDRKKIIQSAKSGDIVVVSYGLVLSEMATFSSREWNIAVLDEAQSIKNHTAKRSFAVKSLRANIRIAATGTPIENRLPELWSIFDFLNPGLLGTESEFENKFCSSDADLASLKKLVSPLIMRRMKKDVLDDLPEKQEITIEVELPSDERALYEAMRRNAVDELRSKKDNRISILAQLTKLRRVCCHPSLINPELEFAGAKLQRIMELVRELYSGGHRALIFSQYVDFLGLLRKELEREDLTYQYLDGSTPSDERLRLVDAFQHGSGDFFLISLKAGGVGLNLTAANYVILADPWWNPAVEDQAADRVYRIGQKNPVTVYRMVTMGTVEEKVIAMHKQKRFLAEDVLSGAGQTAITSEELLHLFDE